MPASLLAAVFAAGGIRSPALAAVSASSNASAIACTAVSARPGAQAAVLLASGTLGAGSRERAIVAVFEDMPTSLAGRFAQGLGCAPEPRFDAGDVALLEQCVTEGEQRAKDPKGHVLLTQLH